jgi:urea transport system permease protein
MDPTSFGEAISNSLSLGSILVLAAIGLAITFGVMRVINMAHGEMMTLGAYTAVVVTDDQRLPAWIHSFAANFGLDWNVSFNIFVAIPLAFLIVGAIGFLLEITLIRYLYGRPLDTLLATWGVGLIIQQTVNLVFGANLQPTKLPEILEGTPTIVQDTPFAIPTLRLFIFGVTFACLLAVYVWFFKTTSGLKIRAVVQNRSMASALGVSTRRVDSLTFAFASGLAGIAGCVLAHLYTVKYNMGGDYIVNAFMVVTLGGMGQLAGAVGAAAIIATGISFVEKLLGDYRLIDSPTAMAKVLGLLLVIVFLLIRPTGLFTTKERSYDA